MENIIETRDADKPQAENVGTFTEQPSIPEGNIPQENAGYQAESITEETAQESSKEDSTRFEYWQSQADKAKGELSDLRKEVDYYKGSLAPVEQMLRENPQILDRLEGSPSNGQAPGYPNTGVQGNSLKEPVAPEKPHSYNEVDAYNDAQSESFEYRLAKEKYRDDYLTHLQEKDQVREKALHEQYRQQMSIQQNNLVRQQAASHAVNSYGWDHGKANEFVQWAQAPENLTLDNLAKLFELRTNPDPVVKQRTEEMQNQRERMNLPRTASVQPGKSEQPRNDEQFFSDALLGKV
jgi:hypothetical protein